MKDIVAIINQLAIFRSPNFLLQPILHKKISLPFTARERNCAACLLKGMTAKEIGKFLKISYRTVESHLEHMKSKLSCSTKSQLIAKIFEENFHK